MLQVVQLRQFVFVDNFRVRSTGLLFGSSNSHGITIQAATSSTIWSALECKRLTGAQMLPLLNRFICVQIQRWILVVRLGCLLANYPVA